MTNNDVFFCQWQCLSLNFCDMIACERSKQLHLDQSRAIIICQMLVSISVSRQVEEGRALLWDVRKYLFHLFILSPPSRHVLTNTHFILHLSFALSFFDGMTQEEAEPCSQRRRPHWMRLKWAVINLGCPISPLYHFNGCYLPLLWRLILLIGAKDEERKRRGGRVAMGRGEEIKPNPYRGK